MDCISSESSSAGVTQLVEYLPSKQNVVGSSPIARSTAESADFQGLV